MRHGLNGRQLIDIGNQICMTEQNGFRRALGTGGKHDNCFFIAAYFMRHMFDFIVYKRAKFNPKRHFLGQIFQINDFNTGGLNVIYGLL